ncbi:MAG: hypothetical protein WCY08_12275 [Rhodocyclaceae bacterium]
MENLYQQLDKAETPEARASIAERIQAMSGRSAPERNLSNEFIIRKVPVYDGKGIMQGEQEEIVHLPTYLQQQQGGQVSPVRAVGTTSRVGDRVAVWDGTKWVERT